MFLQTTPIVEPFDHDDPGLLAQSEALLDRAFGIGRRTKTSYRFREGESAVPGLSFGLWLPASDAPDGSGERLLVAIISYWHLRIGSRGMRRSCWVRLRWSLCCRARDWAGC
jgi:hypothetical protein